MSTAPETAKTPCYLTGHQWVLYADLHEECGVCGLCLFSTRAGHTTEVQNTEAIRKAVETVRRSREKAAGMIEYTRVTHLAPKFPPSLPLDPDGLPPVVTFHGQGRDRYAYDYTKAWGITADFVLPALAIGIVLTIYGALKAVFG